MASEPTNQTSLPVVDSHIHLYAASHIPSLSWTADLPSDHRLNRQNSLDQYRTAIAQHSKNIRGFVFVETDRKSGLDDTQWGDPLKEVDFLIRIAQGTPHEDEGHHPEDGKLVLGIVPWAPVPAGKSALIKYIAQVQEHASNRWHLVKGFRYLVQDKEAGLMLRPTFIEGLRHLGSHNFTFDLGIDARSAGLHQLKEACEMMEHLYRDGSTLKIIINHLCKPDLRLTPKEICDKHSSFMEWETFIEKMASNKHTYMKLSGMFSELPPQSESCPVNISLLVAQTKPWTDVVFKAFGPSRIMFGSDWPVCNVGGPGLTKSWAHWHELVDAILLSHNLSQEEKARVWSGTAMEAYNIKHPT